MQHTILVVEDDHDTSLGLRKCLEHEGYCVFSAPHGQEALTTLRRIEAPSLILVDLLMPLGSGEELLREIELDPELCKIPIVILTGQRERAQKMNGKRVLHKPFDLEELLRTVREYCETPWKLR